MTRFSKSFLFPDVNVWVALSYAGHRRHSVAKEWFEKLAEDDRLCFCRFTQLSLLRLLTTQAVMDDEVMTQREAWAAYDGWLSDRRISFVEEPLDLDAAFRALSHHRNPSPKIWSDAYLAAFAAIAGLRFVTFDQAFQGSIGHLLILKPAH